MCVCVRPQLVVEDEAREREREKSRRCDDEVASGGMCVCVCVPEMLHWARVVGNCGTVESTCLNSEHADTVHRFDSSVGGVRTDARPGRLLRALLTPAHVDTLPKPALAKEANNLPDR